MNEVKSSNIYNIKNKANIKYYPYSSQKLKLKQKGIIRVLSSDNIKNPNNSKIFNIYKNYSFLPLLYNANNFKDKTKENYFNASLPNRNNYKIELEKLYDQNSNYKKIILKLKSEIDMINRDSSGKEKVLNTMNLEIEKLIKKYEEKIDINDIGPIKLEEKNKYILIRKMKNKINETEQELSNNLFKNKNLRKHTKFTKFNELKIENTIINEHSNKILLLIENSKELNNNQKKEIKQNKMYSNNYISQKSIIYELEEKLRNLNQEENNTKNEIINFEKILNQTNDKFKIIKLKQDYLKNQNILLNKEKNEFDKKENSSKTMNYLDKNNYYSLEKFEQKLSQMKNEYNYNKIKNQKIMEKLNNMKKNYNSSLEKYKSIGNKSFEKENKEEKIINEYKMKNEERINELKKTYKENKDKENELENLLSDYKDEIENMNNDEDANINIEKIRNKILKFIVQNGYKKNDKILGNNLTLKNDLILSKQNPYNTDNKENNPILTEKFTNEQFRQFTYVLFKNFEAKKIGTDKGKNEIITPLINYYNIINNDDNQPHESDIQEKLAKKFSEIILSLLNSTNENDKKNLKIFFNSIYFDKVINMKNKTKNQENEINMFTDYFLSLFNFIHEYNKNDEMILKHRIKSNYNISFSKLKDLLKENILSKKKDNNNKVEDNDYITIQELKTILDNNKDLRLKELYIEYLIYCMKQFNDDKSSLFDLKVKNMDNLLDNNENDKDNKNKEKEKEKENKFNESFEELTPDEYNNNIYSVLIIIKHLLEEEKTNLRQLFTDSIVTINKPKCEVITLDSFNNELNKRNINLNYLQISCINNKYCINDELYALDINKIEKDISNLKENEINNFL